MRAGTSAGLDAKPTLRTRWTALESRVYKRLRTRADLCVAARSNQFRPQHLLTGEQGEDAAYFFLRQLGYQVVARRWRSARLRGDLDLVAWDGRTLVIAEVKTRTARDLYAAEDAVDRDKRNQLRAQVQAYLRRIPEPFRSSIEVRFDIVAVYLLGDKAEFEHFPSAFPRMAPLADRPRFPWRG